MQHPIWVYDMKKSVVKIILIGLLMTGTASVAFGEMPNDGIDTEVTSVSIEMSQNVVRVTGAHGAVLEIYKVTGVSVDKIKIDSNDKRIELNLQKGCYILKVGKVVRKISIR